MPVYSSLADWIYHPPLRKLNTARYRAPNAPSRWSSLRHPHQLHKGDGLYRFCRWLFPASRSHIRIARPAFALYGCITAFPRTAAHPRRPAV